MDPYGNTKGIQVAIANEDKGADSEQMSLDAGNIKYRIVIQAIIKIWVLSTIYVPHFFTEFYFCMCYLFIFNVKTLINFKY